MTADHSIDQQTAMNRRLLQQQQQQASKQQPQTDSTTDAQHDEHYLKSDTSREL